MKKHLAVVAAGVAASCVLALSLAGCAGADSSKQAEPQDGVSRQEQQASEVEAENTLESNISISDVNMREAKVCSTSVDEYDPQRGYAISASVTNDNDVSCDVTPYFAVDIAGIDDYGAEQTERAVIYGSEVFTPYGVETARSMQSVGLAPHETKTVWYYVYLDESNPLLASPLAGEGDDAALKDEGGEYGPIQLESGKRIEYYSEDITSLANIELVSFDAEEAKKTYVPAKEWREGVAVGTKYDDGSSWGGYPTYESVMFGSIANSTQDRWLTAEVQFDVRVGAYLLNAAGVRGTYCPLDHIDVGGSKDLVEASIAISQEEYDVVISPALLAYEPDES